MSLRARTRSRTLVAATAAGLVAVAATGCVSVMASPEVVTTAVGVPVHVCATSQAILLPTDVGRANVHFEWGDGGQTDLTPARPGSACADHAYDAPRSYHGRVSVDGGPASVWQSPDALSADFTVYVTGTALPGTQPTPEPAPVDRPAPPNGLALAAEPVPGERKIWVHLADPTVVSSCSVQDLTVQRAGTATASAPQHLGKLEGSLVSVAGPGTYDLSLHLVCTAPGASQPFDTTITTTVSET